MGTPRNEETEEVGNLVFWLINLTRAAVAFGSVTIFRAVRGERDQKNGANKSRISFFPLPDKKAIK